MASVHPRTNANGSVTHRLFYYDGGRQRSMGFADESDAKRWADVFDTLGPTLAMKALKEALEGPVQRPDEPTVAEMLEAHISQLTGIQDGTRRDYRSFATKHINPYVGQVRRSELTRAVGADWINALQQRGLAGKTIQGRYTLLVSAIESQAVEDGHLPKNPLRGFRLPDASRQREDVQALSAEQFRTFLPCIRPFYRDLALTLVGTGIRIGEAFALQVRHVRLEDDRPRLLVHGALKHRHDSRREVGTPKTRHGRREIPLSETVQAALRRSVEGKGPDDLVFTSVRGRPARYASFWVGTWGPAQRQALELGFHSAPQVHDLRHTAASWWLSANVPILTVSRLLGHSKASFTLDRYGHFLPADDRLVVAATDDRLAGL